MNASYWIRWLFNSELPFVSAQVSMNSQPLLSFSLDWGIDSLCFNSFSFCLLRSMLLVCGIERIWYKKDVQMWNRIILYWPTLGNSAVMAAKWKMIETSEQQKSINYTITKNNVLWIYLNEQLSRVIKNRKIYYNIQ